MSSSGVVYYKFKSQKEHDTCSFDGTGISVFDLKKEIIIANKLGKCTDFDLALYNPQTDEEYTDDTYIIQRSASVIVRRLPASKPGKGTAQRYVNGYMPSSNNNRNRGSQPVNVHGKMSATFGGKSASNTKPEPAKPKINVEAPKTDASDNPSLNIYDDSEEAQIKMMFKQVEEQWEQQQEKLAEATPVYTRNPKRQQPHPQNQQNAPQKVPPPTYVCFRCGTRGHYINNCPTNGDKEYDKQPRIKRTTGIPRSFLKVVDEPKKDGPSGLMVTPQGGLVVAVADSASWEKHKAITRSTLANGDIYEKVPVKSELQCQLCHRLFREAAQIPCCKNSFCDDCIRNYLLENDFTCPMCHSANQIPDDLIRNFALRKEVDNYLREYTLRLKQEHSPSAASTPKTPPKTEIDNNESDSGEKIDTVDSGKSSSQEQDSQDKNATVSPPSEKDSSEKVTESKGDDIDERQQVLQQEDKDSDNTKTTNNDSTKNSGNSAKEQQESSQQAKRPQQSSTSSVGGNTRKPNNNTSTYYEGPMTDRQSAMMLPNNPAAAGFWDGPPLAGGGGGGGYMGMNDYPPATMMNMPLVPVHGPNFYGEGEFYDDAVMDYTGAGFPPFGYGHPPYDRPYAFGPADPSIMEPFNPHTHPHYNGMAPYPAANGIPPASSFPQSSSFEQYHHPHHDRSPESNNSNNYNNQTIPFYGRNGLSDFSRMSYSEKKAISQMKRPLDVVDVHAATHQARQRKTMKTG